METSFGTAYFQAVNGSTREGIPELLRTRYSSPPERAALFPGSEESSDEQKCREEREWGMVTAQRSVATICMPMGTGAKGAVGAGWIHADASPQSLRLLRRFPPIQQKLLVRVVIIQLMSVRSA